MAWFVRSRWWLVCALAAVVLAGCTRNRYRIRADKETYGILAEKTTATPWHLPWNFDVLPDPRSRFSDPTPINDPLLPVPSPNLYAFDLPELPPRDPARFDRSARAADDSPAALAGRGEPIASDSDSGADTLIQLVAHQEDAAPEDDESEGAASDDVEYLDFTESAGSELPVVPIPKEVWESLPKNCLQRMFEFQSVRDEYERTFGRQPPAELRDDSQRLALEDIVDVALINSREYQTEKEDLYQFALQLTLARYDFFLKFATTENGTDVDFRHNRAAGITVNNLDVPTRFTGDKVLATGGDLLARFANDVLLTFNGPEGFAADIGSELLLDISQTVFQRDIRFERLTQFERNVVYAARDFARFRKEFFRDLAVDYYNLVLTYRRIEIDTQGYFSNLRAFNQGEAELRAGRQSRVQVDQLEQEALRSRSVLIGRCNSLEESMDVLKVRMGIPPELPINLDLTELDQLTLRDSAVVSGERVRRARRDLQIDRQLEPSAQRQDVFINDGIKLARRMRHSLELHGQLGHEQTEPTAEVDLVLARLQVDEAREPVRIQRKVLETIRTATPPKPPVQVFRRTMDLVDSLVELVRRQRALADLSGVDAADADLVESGQAELNAGIERVRKLLQQVVTDRDLGRLPELIAAADAELLKAETLAAAADTLAQYAELPDDQRLTRTLQQVDWLLAESKQMLSEETGGLVPVDIDMDDAMLTALVQRFDLINERGQLADSWRAIKLAGDDLKSVLNLQATQSVRTEKNRPFAFTFDESQTRLRLSFDAPLNRKEQRNVFRTSLIDYNFALRQLMQLEDGVKLSVRDQLRNLQLSREQYQIAVASAALAYERVVSTRLELQLGRDVSARDFLEAQQDYTASLNAVAVEHIDYITGRIQLFLDLESLQVDDNGFWPELYNDDYQPTPYYQLPPYALPAYGHLPCNVLYSHKVKRMLHVPTGCSTIFRTDASEPDELDHAPELIPPPEPTEELLAPPEP